MTRSYKFTQRGETIARETGLEQVSEVLENDYDLLRNEVLDEVTDYGWGFDLQGNDALQPYRERVLGRLMEVDEGHLCVKGLAVETTGSQWVNPAVPLEGTLIDEGAPFAPVGHPDALVLSGALEVAAFDENPHLERITTSVGERLGHNHRIQSMAFVGAYALSKHIEGKEDRLNWGADPSFKVQSGAEEREIGAGGTFHGDFLMWERRNISGLAVSPVGTVTEFSPTEKVHVAGYHSIEPSITSDMLADIYFRGGDKALREAIAQFRAQAQAAMESSGQNPVVPFADYGGAGMRYEVIHDTSSIRGAISRRPGFAEREMMSSSPYSPQSETHFSVSRIDDGLRFANRQLEDEGMPKQGIDVAVENYPDMFRTLVGQAVKGSGRTSPDQHIKVINEAERLLDDPVYYDGEV